MVQFTIGVSSFTQKPVARKPVNLVCMTPWMRNWSLASSFGLSVTCCMAQGHSVPGHQGLFALRWDSHFCSRGCMLHSLPVGCALIPFKEGGCQQPRLGSGDFDYVTSVSFVIR